MTHKLRVGCDLQFQISVLTHNPDLLEMCEIIVGIWGRSGLEIWISVLVEHEFVLGKTVWWKQRSRATPTLDENKHMPIFSDIITWGSVYMLAFFKNSFIHLTITPKKFYPLSCTYFHLRNYYDSLALWYKREGEKDKNLRMDECLCLGKIKRVELSTTVRSRIGAGLGGSRGSFASVVMFSSYGGMCKIAFDPLYFDQIYLYF